MDLCHQCGFVSYLPYVRCRRGDRTLGNRMGRRIDGPRPETGTGRPSTSAGGSCGDKVDSSRPGGPSPHAGSDSPGGRSESLTSTSPFPEVGASTSFKEREREVRTGGPSFGLKTKNLAGGPSPPRLRRRRLPRATTPGSGAQGRMGGSAVVLGDARPEGDPEYIDPARARPGALQSLLGPHPGRPPHRPSWPREGKGKSEPRSPRDEARGFRDPAGDQQTRGVWRAASLPRGAASRGRGGVHGVEDSGKPTCGSRPRKPLVVL